MPERCCSQLLAEAWAKALRQRPGELLPNSLAELRVQAAKESAATHDDGLGVRDVVDDLRHEGIEVLPTMTEAADDLPYPGGAGLR